MRSPAWAVFLGYLVACGGSPVADGLGAGDAASVDAGAAAGPESVASLIQLPPTQLASDGTTLFWRSNELQFWGPVWSQPISGGAPSTIVQGSPVLGDGPDSLLSVDALHVYYGAPPDAPNGPAGRIYAAAKDGGGAPVLVSGAVGPVAVRGTQLFWIEGAQPDPLVLKTLRGGVVSSVAQFQGDYIELGVTATTVFLYDGRASTWDSFALDADAGIMNEARPAPFSGPEGGCIEIVSDDDAIYCCPTGSTAPIWRIASDGTTTVLGEILAPTTMTPNYGSLVVPSNIAVDDRYVYWVDSVPVGTVTRVPKAGGTPAVIARDTSPIAVAVDAHAVYWSDFGGNIWRLQRSADP